MTADPRRRLGQRLKAAQLTVGVRAVALALWAFTDWKTGRAVPSVAGLAELSGIEERDVRRHLRTMEQRGLIAVEHRAGRRSTYQWLDLWMTLTPGAGTPGDTDPDGVLDPGVQDPGEGGCGDPGRGGVGTPPIIPFIQHAAAAAARTPGTDRRAEPLPEAVEILRAHLTRSGLNVRWDTLTTAELDEVEALVGVQGDARLVKAALASRAGHTDPPVYARAWLATWRALPAPGRALAAVPTTRCQAHHQVHPCTGCAADAKASR